MIQAMKSAVQERQNANDDGGTPNGYLNIKIFLLSAP
jgi:hypothetical protein